MAISTQQLQQALDRAKSEPGSAYAKELQNRLQTGRFDAQLSEIGLERTPKGLRKAEIRQPVGSETKQDFLGIGRDILRGAERGAEKFTEAGEAFDRGEISRGEMTLRKTGALAGSGASAIGAAFEGAVKLALPQKAENKLKELVGQFGEKVVENEQVQQAIKWYSELPEDAQKNIDAVGGIASLAAEFVGGGAVKRGATGVRRVAGEATEQIAKSFDEGIDAARRTVAESTFLDDTTDTIRKTMRLEAPETLAQQREVLRRNFIDDVIGDNTSVNRKLDKIARQEGLTQDDILNELIDEGGVPQVKGTKTDFSEFVASVDRENEAISKAVNRRVDQLTETTNIEDMRNAVIADIKSARAMTANQDAIVNRVNKIFDNYKSNNRFGDELTPANINEIRVEMNRKWKGQDPQDFEIDAFNSIGDQARKRLTEIDPSLTDATAYQGRLNRVMRTADALDLRKISVNDFVDKLGGFAGVMLTSGLGLSAIAGGPAGLLIAGMGANLGAKALAGALRARKFSPKRLNLIKASLDENPAILRRIIEQADAEDKAILESRLLPAPEPGAPRVQSTGGKVIELPKEAPSTVEAREIENLSGGLDNGAVRETVEGVSDDLIKEAKKYKSGEEFVKAQGTPVYRGGADLSKEKITNAGISVSKGKNVAEDFVKQKGGKVEEIIISPNAKIANYSDVPNVKFKNLNDYSSELDTGNRQIWRDLEVEYQKAVNWAKENGYDGIKLPLEGETRIINKDIIKTKSQLEEIWKKANNDR